MTDLTLTANQLYRLTGKRRSDAQRRVLDYLGIEYKPRPDGTLAVLHSEVEKQLSSGEGKRHQTREPKWEAM